MKYKVGDKVRVRKDLDADKWYGDDSVVSEMMPMRGIEATISEIINNTKYRIKECAWSWTDEMFEPKCDRKILITSDGAVTLARLYDGKKVVKTKTAKCSPEDVFDFATGAKLAFERLMGEDKPEPKPKPEYYSGKVVCVKGYADYWTVGKPYEFVDGKVTCDKGHVLGDVDIHCIEDVNKHFSAQFIPFVEDKPPFDWAGFKRRDFAVNCDTKEKAKAFLAECYQHGLFWSDRDVSETMWDINESDTCYSFSLGTLGYTEKSWYKKQGIKVIPYR